MSQASQLSRYKPAVFTITGAAAVYGLYVLYTTLSTPPPKTGLQRSNAIRGSRRSRTGMSIDYTRPRDGEPLGSIEIGTGPSRCSFNLAISGVPSEAAFEMAFGQLPTDVHFMRDVRVACIECVLQACFLARDPSRQAPLAERGLILLVDLLQDRDSDNVSDSVLANADLITPVLNGVSNVEIELAVSRFTSGSVYTEAVTDASTSIQVTDEAQSSIPEEPSGSLKAMLYHIAEENAHHKNYEHRGIHCEECNEGPIRGIRWHCLNCPDFDLCTVCKSNTDHPKTHVFVEIRIPLPVLSQPTKEQPLWYPGDPKKIHASLPSELKKRLQEAYKFDASQIEAHYDQFLCLANVPWNDPNGTEGAIDRRSFNRALTSERWPQRFRPNVMYDRMFAFYDTNADGLIGFEEFVSGLAYLRGPMRFRPLRRALKGFDIDDDGYLSRADFIRLFRAKHEMQKLVIGSMIEGRENEQTVLAMENIRSSRPISSAFNVDSIPPGYVRPPGGKGTDAYGDLQPLPGTRTMLQDDEGWPEEPPERQLAGPSNGNGSGSHERPQHHTSRFEEMFSNPTEAVDNNTHATLGSHNMVNGENTYHSNGPTEAIPVHRHSSSSINHTIGTEETTGEDRPLNQDILWQVIEDGFHELLDPIFRAKEEKDQEVLNSCDERKTFSDLLAAAKGEAEKIYENWSQLQSAVTPTIVTNNGNVASRTIILKDDKPNSTPLSRAGHANSTNESEHQSTLDLTDPPNDEEIEIPAQKFLPVSQFPPTMLKTIYWNAVEAVASKRPPLNSDPHSAPQYTIAKPTTSPHSEDPTMPQNRPNTNATIPDEAISPYPFPTPERLAQLIEYTDADRRIRYAGGPGRLSLEEFADLAQGEDADRRRIRGLVVGWLEWASF